jgi:hypothetical protein
VNGFKEKSGIGTIKKGEKLTVCGKQPMDCDTNHSEKLNLKYDAISFFNIDENRYHCFYFDNKLNTFADYIVLKKYFSKKSKKL